MKFIKKLYNNIIDSMYYVELHFLLYFSTVFIIFILSYYYINYYGTSGMGWMALFYSFCLTILYIFCLIIYILHLYNKFHFKKKIPEAHKFTDISKLLYTLTVIINIICNIYFWLSIS